METSLNIDAKTLEMCLKSIKNIGNTVYKNICSGETYTVPWGAHEWLTNIVLDSFFVLVVAVLILVAIAVIKESS